MNILLLGSGGREHAMAWKISQSKLCKNLFIAPGNAGTKECGENININPNDFDAVSGFAIKENIDLLVIGPEEPLVRGIYDHFTNIPNLKHIKICGPSKAGAMLEGSKSLAKNFMKRYGIPTAAFATFEHHQKSGSRTLFKETKISFSY